MTILVLIFGEIIPKSYATNHAKKIAIFSTPIFRLLNIILFPAIIILETLTNAIAGKHGIDAVSEDEIRALTRQGAKQGTIEKQERLMIERLFKFNDITAEDIMTPRVMVTFIDDDLTIDEVTEIIEKSTHSRYPVIHETPDTIIGFVHSRDVLLAHHRDNENQSIKQIVRPIVTIPRQMKIDDCLREFQKQKIHVGVVVDEYGGTEGIVTLEDVIEELVGEITDEYDIDESSIDRIDKKTIVATGGTTLRDIDLILNAGIEGDKNDTIAETILDTLGNLPKKGQKIDFGTATCTILEVKRRRIESVKIQKK
jgi:CBS domain containing-hemolysin-like protein